MAVPHLILHPPAYPRGGDVDSSKASLLSTSSAKIDYPTISKCCYYEKEYLISFRDLAMDKLFIGCCVLGSLLALQGCATTGMYSRTGFGLYSNYTEASIGRNLNENLRAGNKVGEACTRNYWGIVAVGDSSVDAAKRAGYISVISSIDYKYLNILGFYGKACTVVSGQ